MNSLDYLLILPLIYFAFRGFKNGIIHEFLSIAGLVLAIFFSFFYMDTLADSFAIIFKQDSPYLPFFTGSILFIGVLIATHILSRALWGAFKFLHLNFLNRIFGVMFGLIKGGVLLSAILLFFAYIDIPGPDARSNSLLYPHLIDLAPLAYDFIASILPGIEEFRTTLEKSFQNQEFLDEFFKK